MDVTDLLRRLGRHRIAVVLAIGLALAAAAAGYVTAGSSRQGGAAVVIVPPAYGDTVPGVNPLTNLDNNLAQLANVLATAMQSTAATDALAKQGATASFTISTVTGNNPSFSQLSPQLVFTVSGRDAAVVNRTTVALVAEAKSQLNALQNSIKVPATARASLVQVVAPTDAQAVGSGKLRSAGSLGLAVLVVGLLLILLVDQLRRRRDIDRYDASTSRAGHRRHSAG